MQNGWGGELGSRSLSGRIPTNSFARGPMYFAYTPSSILYLLSSKLKLFLLLVKKYKNPIKIMYHVHYR